jgi:nitrite reductase/ring-hydroxylating ferredoxin subunit
MPEHRTAVLLCNSSDLVNGGDAVSFDVVYGGHACRAFGIRFQGQVYAYLNRCTHVAMELD